MQKYYVDSPKLLKKAIDAIQDNKIIAIDTEFTRQKTYYPILSLIQIAAGDQVFAIDCLAKIDLEPIYDIILNQEIKKIFHSCNQDLQIFHQKSNEIGKNICDIQLMANFCGIGYNIGYSGLVEEVKGIKISKEMQRSDWQKRPLSAKQIEYAMIDVFYLEEIYEELWQILQQKKREKWFLEEMEIATQEICKRNEDNLLKNFTKDRKIYAKNPDRIAKLKELIIWREKRAQELDVPRRHFLKDEALDAIITGQISRLNLSKKDILQAEEIMQKEQKFAVDFATKTPIMNQRQKELFQESKKILAEIAQEESLKEQFLITSGALKEAIIGKKKIAEITHGWRYSLFGKKIEKLIS